MSLSAEINKRVADRRAAIAEKLKPGAWVLFEPLVTAWAFALPCEVTKVSGRRVYIRRPRRNKAGEIEDYSEAYKDIDGVRLVVSSEAIAQEIVDTDRRISSEREAELEIVRKAHNDRLKAAIDFILQKE